MDDLFHYLLGGGLWGLMIIGGPILLGIAIAWGIVTNRARTRRQREATERGTRELYEKVEREEQGRPPR